MERVFLREWVMPFEIANRGEFRLARLLGVVTAQDLAGFARAAEGIEDSLPTAMDRATDITSAQSFDVDYLDVLALAVERRARMSQTLNDNPQIEIRILESLQEAEDWFAESGTGRPALRISRTWSVRTDVQLTAVIRRTVPRREIRHEMGPGIAEVMDAAAAQGVIPAGPAFSHHLRMDPDIFDFVIGVPVASPVSAAEGHASGPDLWECYATGPDSDPDPAAWRTELNRPLTR
jgi:hypothetical protein